MFSNHQAYGSNQHRHNNLCPYEANIYLKHPTFDIGSNPRSHLPHHNYKTMNPHLPCFASHHPKDTQQ